MISMPMGMMSGRGNKRFIKEIMMKIKFVLDEPKAMIIKILSEGTKSTSDIHKALDEKGYSMSKSTLYYYLSNMESEGIIKMSQYREEGGGAPEKMWDLAVKRICVDIVTGKVEFDANEKVGAEQK